MKKTPKTLLDIIRYFSDEKVCVTFLEKLRWDLGIPCCMKCGSTAITRMRNRPIYQCKEKGCRYQFGIRMGTVMENSPIPLSKWLPCFWMICNDKNGISSYEVARGLGVTQKSAWFMLHRVREAMQDGFFAQLSGEVEIDETYVGGKGKNKSYARGLASGIQAGRALSNKTVVRGMVERGGKIVADVIENPRRHHLLRGIRERIADGTVIYTDALKSYQALDNYYDHQVIDHSKAYVQGAIHTNTLENFWSLLKRSLKGTYVQVMPYHLERYVIEQAYRYNNRKRDDLTRFIICVSQIFGRRLTYEQLISRGAEI